jgi:hypothetical protein
MYTASIDIEAAVEGFGFDGPWRMLWVLPHVRCAASSSPRCPPFDSFKALFETSFDGSFTWEDLQSRCKACSRIEACLEPEQDLFFDAISLISRCVGPVRYGRWRPAKRRTRFQGQFPTRRVLDQR